MKYIKVPEDVKLTTWSGEVMKDQSGEQAVITFKDFVVGRLMDPKFSKDMSTILRAVEIKGRLEKMEKVLMLEDIDFELLADATRSPSPQYSYNPAISHCLVAYLKAITEASSVEPV
jgi:hypothetical protein